VHVLVAQGFSQIPRIDFFKTYTPVAKIASMCVLFAMATHHNFEIHQVNVKGAYLNGEFKEGEVIYYAPTPLVSISQMIRLLSSGYSNLFTGYTRAAGNGTIGSRVS